MKIVTCWGEWTFSGGLVGEEFTGGGVTVFILHTLPLRVIFYPSSFKIYPPVIFHFSVPPMFWQGCNLYDSHFWLFNTAFNSEFQNSFDLKELRNYNQVIFVSTTKIGKNTTNILKLLFFCSKFTLCHINPNNYK